MQAAAAAASLGAPAGAKCAGGGPCPQEPRGAAGERRRPGRGCGTTALPRPAAGSPGPPPPVYAFLKTNVPVKSVQRELAVHFRSVPMEIYSAAAGRVGSHRHLLMVEQPCKNGGYLFFRKASANPLSFSSKVRPLKNTLWLSNILGLIRLRWHSAGLFVFLN